MILNNFPVYAVTNIDVTRLYLTEEQILGNLIRNSEIISPLPTRKVTHAVIYLLIRNFLFSRFRSSLFQHRHSLILWWLRVWLLFMGAILCLLLCPKFLHGSRHLFAGTSSTHRLFLGFRSVVARNFGYRFPRHWWEEERHEIGRAKPWIPSSSSSSFRETTKPRQPTRLVPLESCDKSSR